MSDNKTPLNQPIQNRQIGADVAGLGTEPTQRLSAPRTPSPAGTAASVAQQAANQAPGCTQRISLAFFFDGTGNNLDADKGTGEHSNVARLFNAHTRDNDVTLTFRRYLPGIGTYFKEIGDPGGTTTGNGMGAYGQKRLNWAFKELAIILQKAEARAQNPTNRILEVRISAFGFSRGAALARAFCRDLQKSCTGSPGKFQVKPGAMGTSGMALKGAYPIDLYFLGLFDSVASVGLPMSANNVVTKRRNGFGWRDVLSRGESYGGAERDLQRLAFGAPGADPSPGIANGHGDWADNLAIAPIVSQCLHLVAGHEMRNSFPMDSVLQGTACPPGTVEIVYPGVHSDVGGGYRQGEGGKSSLLAIMPLRTMFEKAIEAKVPLLPYGAARSSNEKMDFALDEASKPAFDALLHCWKKYSSSVNGGVALGQSVLNHMSLYWRYRLSVALLRTDPAHAGRSGRSGKQRQLTLEQQTIQQNEQTFAKDRKGLIEEANKRRVVHYTAASRREGAEQGLAAAKSSPGFTNQVPMWEAQIATARLAEDEAYDEWRQAQAKVDGAANDSELIASLDVYDAWLLEDAGLVHGWHKDAPGKRLRPHYKALIEAYDEVVVRKQPMAADSDLFKFFNLYVHDSLAAFATDNTRPSDPRVIYIGGGIKKDYAAAPASTESAALA
jgi:Uncharacterized alpha/beta hydrolase domain (DUF2235)